MSGDAEFRRGQLVRLYVQFANADSENPNNDPSTVSLQIRFPDDTAGDPITSFDGHVAQSGAYQYDLAVDQDGRHYWRWTGEGDVDAIAEGSFWVRRSPVLEAAG